jgi:tripartite-type tricarboxylate transporter receptor subunit TctC
MTDDTHMRTFASLLIGGCAVLSSAAHAQPRVDFTGKTVTIISSFGAGGGYTTYADLLARHLGVQLPGRPSVIVKTMPGAGGLNGTNYLANVAPRDGTVLGVVPQTVAIAQALGEPGVRYDVRAFNWIGRVNSNVEVQQTWHTSPVKTIADARTHEAILAGTGPQSSSVVFPRILDAMFGMKFRVVAGYEGVNMATLAMERGEVDGVLRPWAVTKTVRPEWLRDRKLNLLVQYGVARHAELGSVPAVVELAETATEREILTLFASGSDIGRAVVAPPGVAPAMVAALRAAFTAALDSPAFRNEAQASGIDLDPLAGNGLQELISRAVDVVPQDVDAARKYSGARP